MIQRTHLLARGLIFRGSSEILLCRARGTSHTFLPGGHLEQGESLVETLACEIAEELGVSCEVGAYLGAVEFQWPPEAPTEYEINHIFRVAIDPTQSLASKESHLSFSWCPVAQLDDARLGPPALRALVQQYAAGDRAPWWATNVHSPTK